MAGLNVSIRRTIKRPDKEALKAYVFEQLKTLWRDCISAFILEAIQHVHVDTGMSEASFYDLATNVRLANAVIADIHGKGPKPAHPSYDHQKGVKKSIAFGKRLGGDRGRAYDFSFGVPDYPRLMFKFNIVVYQYKLHELGYTDSRKGGTSHPAWNSLENGRRAFINCWHNNFKYRIKTRKILDFLFP